MVTVPRPLVDRNNNQNDRDTITSDHHISMGESGLKWCFFFASASSEPLIHFLKRLSSMLFICLKFLVPLFLLLSYSKYLPFLLRCYFVLTSTALQLHSFYRGW